MKRIIVNLNKTVLNVYVVTDDYLKECFEHIEPVDRGLSRYLDESGYFSILLDTNYDIFEKNTISDFRTLRTDGYWIWSADLNYYYEKFGFKWPQEFVAFCKSNKVSNLSDSLLDQILIKYSATIMFLQHGLSDENSEIYPFNEIELR
ncbi:hypothetical protein NAT51_19255 [Flavobacterium amniphilum]|uniref:hypothetical protein n=1 Tax=Flavobacterium amniphilum TaxID=1834035 RepID=UPI002029E170|nr:hypothetical protein [Flavobacterium amniphilum]MCL9807669.1 hypothetical protein [Flavobacterium amniphilum]